MRVVGVAILACKVFLFFYSLLMKLLLQIIIAILLPPVSVFLKKGIGIDLLINIILTVLGYLPGIIHALWVIFKK